MAAPMNDMPSDICSGRDPIVNDTKFKMTPKLISRYPSVKNLRKLLKKYELMIPPTRPCADSHLRNIIYAVARTIKHTIVPIRENNNEAQFSRNRGDPIPLSRNLELYDGRLSSSIAMNCLNKSEMNSMSIFVNSRISNMILT